MITINATGDTTLYTAGQYCAEDILVKVPAGSGGSSGGGASVEMCTGTLVIDAPTMDTFEIYHMNENLQATTIILPTTGGTFTVAKGTILAVYPFSSLGTMSGGITDCFYSTDGGAFIVSDDFTLTYA